MGRRRLFDTQEKVQNGENMNMQYCGNMNMQYLQVLVSIIILEGIITSTSYSK